MSFWNYIGGFLLFRWLFGKLNRDHNTGSAHNTDTNRHYFGDEASGTSLHHRPPVPPYHGADIYDDEDDALDDYDPTDSDDYSGAFGHHDYGYSQSYDDFDDEQDDYDMIDDDL